MKEMKTIKFPGDTEAREIVDASARERLNEIEKMDFGNGTNLIVRARSEFGYSFANPTSDGGYTIDPSQIKKTFFSIKLILRLRRLPNFFLSNTN